MHPSLPTAASLSDGWCGASVAGPEEATMHTCHHNTDMSRYLVLHMARSFNIFLKLSLIKCKKRLQFLNGGATVLARRARKYAPTGMFVTQQAGAFCAHERTGRRW